MPKNNKPGVYVLFRRLVDGGSCQELRFEALRATLWQPGQKEPRPILGGWCLRSFDGWTGWVWYSEKEGSLYQELLTRRPLDQQGVIERARWLHHEARHPPMVPQPLSPKRLWPPPPRSWGPVVITDQMRREAENRLRSIPPDAYGFGGGPEDDG